MSPISVELASSLTCALHYSSNLTQEKNADGPGRKGAAICNYYLKVYDDPALRRYRCDEPGEYSRMCRECERLAAGDRYQVRWTGDEH